MPDRLEQALAGALSDSSVFGELYIQAIQRGFAISHRDDRDATRLQVLRRVEDAREIARYDEGGNYRPLKTTPTLRRGWRLEVVDLRELRRALDYFYPGRLAMLAAWNENRLTATSLRETLNRQSGMYRIAAKISDEQIDDIVANSCRSDGGCLRTILWKRDERGTMASTKLPAAKFDPDHDQTGCGERAIPLLCQEVCSLLINECRKAVKGETKE